MKKRALEEKRKEAKAKDGKGNGEEMVEDGKGDEAGGEEMVEDGIGDEVEGEKMVGDGEGDEVEGEKLADGEADGEAEEEDSEGVKEEVAMAKEEVAMVKEEVGAVKGEMGTVKGEMNMGNDGNVMCDDNEGEEGTDVGKKAENAKETKDIEDSNKTPRKFFSKSRLGFRL